ncbi:MAG TPA: AgmX/PglI C-terminal domain-containing protein [Polyangiaceae bacterium]
MRTLAAALLLAPILGVPLACGGAGATAGGAVDPGAGAGGAAAASATPVDPGAAPAAGAGPTTTTTTTLGAGGDLQGAKLTQTTTVASTTGSTSAPAKGPHTHEPGRGIADIKAIVVAHRDEARACYDAATAAHPGIQGDLVMQWTIDPKGAVTQVSADSSRSQIAEPGVLACVARVIQKIQFAASPGGYETKASYPFNFKPRGATPAGQ